MSTLEKMARALVVAYLRIESPDTLCVAERVFDHAEQWEIDGAMSLARAALESLKQPDEGTIEAMARPLFAAGLLPHPNAEKQHLIDAFTAAIDHILAEP